MFKLFTIELEFERESHSFLSPLGKCHYFKNLEEINSKKDLFILSIRETIFTLEQMDLFPFKKKNFLINEYNQRPELNSFSFSLNERGSYNIEIERTEIRKLEFPYETNCRYYENNTSFDCNNDCYRKQYMEKLECYPNYDSLLTIELLTFNESELSNFCFYQDDLYIQNLNQEIIRKCNKKCLSSCVENKFEIRKFPDVKNNFLKGSSLYCLLEDESYLSIIYSPKISLMALIISIVNIWSLWHGMNIIILIDNSIKFLRENFLRYILLNIQPIFINNINVTQLIKMIVEKVSVNLKFKVSLHSIENKTL